MADKKISQLTDLPAASVSPSNDVLAIVDTNVTETKKITAKALVDGALNAGTANGLVYLNGSKETTTGSIITYDGTTFGVDDAVVINESGGDNDTRIEGDTDPNLFFVDASTDRIGIGTNTPDALLNVDGVASFGAGSAAAPSIAAAGDLNTGIFFPAADTIGFSEGGVEAMRLDSAGNLGLGVTPSAWRSTQKALQVGSASFSQFSTTTLSLGLNTFWNSSDQQIYINSDYATEYFQFEGQHRWYTAPSDTAGNTISFTQAMTLDASGNLGVGVTSLEGRFEVRGGSIGSTHSFLVGYGANGDNYYTSGSSGIQVFRTGATERARITSAGNVKIGGTADRATTEGTNQLVLFNGTAPVGTLANGVSFYSASGEARVMDAAGNSTLLSPHDQATNEWIFHSKHTPTGKVLRIDVERLLKFVNDHFGLDAVHEFIED